MLFGEFSLQELKLVKG